MDAECRRLHSPVLTDRSRPAPLRRSLVRLLVVATASSALAVPHASAQIRVNPTGVNVNAQGATTVFLTFGRLDGYVPIEAIWCSEVMPALGAAGVQCVPGTVLGQLPLRFDQSRASGTNAFTDIMTIPPSVARRAYQDAATGASSAFFYVRRFRSTSGAPDQYVAVTCRLTGGGARTPLSLTNVRIAFNADAPVLQVESGGIVPAIDARIDYTGTGRLTGRWEVVLPGEALPSANDLLTQASLPIEDRELQRRYTQLARFNIFLPPTGQVVLPGPDPRRLPTTVDGVYHLLLRVEASPDKEGDSNLGAVGAGNGVVSSGAVAGFPMPTLRYIVGSSTTPTHGLSSSSRSSVLVFPVRTAEISADTALTFQWRPVPGARTYRLEVEHSETGAKAGAVLADGATRYHAAPWFREHIGQGTVRWRITAVDARDRELSRSDWWTFTLTPPQ